MNSFSVMPYEHQSILDAYQQWLVGDLYQNYYFDNLDDPNFLQKLSVLQAEGIRHDIGLHASVTHNSIQEASSQIGRKIQSAASLITSSLDDGFSMMNTRMMEVNSSLQNIGQGIGVVNQTLQQGNKILSNIEGGINQMNRGIGAVASGINTLNHNMIAGLSALNQNMTVSMAALSENISQATSIILYQLQQSEIVLKQILDELRIPESQRERRYHIEEGMKYFNKGMQSGDCLYFEDALDEFTTATTIERKDFFSWYYIGMIHLYSKEHINPEKAMSAFDRYIHYVDALPQKHNLFDEAWMMKAECKYLMQDMDAAFSFVEKVMTGSDKAALRGMKYLSATDDSYKQQQAVEILKQLMLKNPYIIMQVLEDYDLINNEFIIQYIKDYKRDVLSEISDLFIEEGRTLESISIYTEVYTQFNEKLTHIKDKINLSKSDLGLIDLLKIKDEIHSISCDVEKFKQEDLNDVFLVSHDSNNKFGFSALKSNRVIIPHQYKLANPFTDKLTSVMDFNDKWGYIDKTGRLIVPFQYKIASCYSEGLSPFQDFSSKWGYLDNTGYVKIDLGILGEESIASSFHEGLAHIQDPRYHNGFIDKTGRVVIQNTDYGVIQSAGDFHEGFAFVRSSNNAGYIDKTGHFVIRLPSNDYFGRDFNEGIARIWLSSWDYVNKKLKVTYGFIDRNGRWITPCNWKETDYDFRDGFARVKNNDDKWGAIDKSGRLIVPCKYSSRFDIF